MSTTKRHNSKAFKRFLVIILTLTIIAVAFLVIRSKYTTDDVTIQNEYHAYASKHALLVSIADNAVQEGFGININAFSVENVMYKVYNNEDQTILVHYWLVETDETNAPFFAKILLSNDYHIVNKEFSEAEDYETFKWNFRLKENLLFLLYSFLSFCATYVVFCFCYGFITMTSKIFNLFKREKRIVTSKQSEEPDVIDLDEAENA